MPRNSTLTSTFQRVNFAVCQGGFLTFLAKFVPKQMLTFFIELEGAIACIYTNRDGPYTCHCLHKRPLLLMNVHETTVIGSRKLGIVFARFILSKVKREKLYYDQPPGECEFKTVCSLLISKSFVIKHSRR